jgi:hypothetical protein
LQFAHGQDEIRAHFGTRKRSSTSLQRHRSEAFHPRLREAHRSVTSNSTFRNRTRAPIGAGFERKGVFRHDPAFAPLPAAWRASCHRGPDKREYAPSAWRVHAGSPACTAGAQEDVRPVPAAGQFFALPSL